MNSDRTSGGAGASWIGVPIHEPSIEEISFIGTSYPVRMVATENTLVWSVPEGAPLAVGGKSSFETRLQRFAVTSTVEAWCFPKLERVRKHEIVLLIDRENGTVASQEIMLHTTKSGERPAISILRGTLAGRSSAYAGFAFPRYKPVGRLATFDDEGVNAAVRFNRSGQPSAIERADVSLRASGHTLQVARSVWAVVWRTAESAGITLCDEHSGIVNGARVTVGVERTLSFGLRTRLSWSVPRD